MRKLPMWNSFTFDFRVQQIRYIQPGEESLFIDFDSLNGLHLLDQFFSDKDAKTQLEVYLQEAEMHGDKDYQNLLAIVANARRCVRQFREVKDKIMFI